MKHKAISGSENAALHSAKWYFLSRKPPNGFTLIELLVAITILGIVAVLGWRGLDSIVRARVALTNALEQTRGMQLAFAQMQSDCAHIATTSAIGSRALIQTDEGRLTLVRTVVADNQPSRVQVVSYRINDGVLIRRESAATRDLKELDVYWQAALGDTDTTQSVSLQAGVTGMTMNTWPKTGGTATLTGLEVSLKLRDRENPMLKIFLLGAV